MSCSWPPVPRYVGPAHSPWLSCPVNPAFWPPPPSSHWEGQDRAGQGRLFQAQNNLASPLLSFQRQSVINEVLSMLDQSPHRHRKRSVIVLYKRGKVKREEESEEEQRPVIEFQEPPVEEPKEKSVAEIYKTTLGATMEGARGPGAVSCKTGGAALKRTPRRQRGQRKNQVD